MKKLVSLLLAGALSFGLLAGCGGGNSGSANTPANNTETTPVDSTTPAGSTETSSVPEGTVIRVAASPTPHAEILKVAKEVLAEQGITLEIEEFTDYIQPNMVTEDGQVDANYFQHITYLNDFNEQNGTHLVSVADLPDGAVIGVPNDPTNEGRALLLLQQEGLITLKEGAGLTATKLDIAENPKNLDIQELEAAQLPRSLDSLDLAVINGNYALQAGLNAADALAVESTDGEAAQAYVNVLVVKEGREEDPAIQALVDALKSDEVKAYMEETWPGAVVPMF